MPQGIVAVLVGEDGREIATATDFNCTAPGGFSQQEAQRIRARDRLASRAIYELSSPLLSSAVDNYLAKQIMDKMCGKGCKVIFVPIGYEC